MIDRIGSLSLGLGFVYLYLYFAHINRETLLGAGIAAIVVSLVCMVISAWKDRR